MTQPTPPFVHRMSSPRHEIDLRRSSAIIAVKVVHSAIFLPRWCADRIPQLCTPPLLIGVLALVVNAWRRAARRQVSDQRPGSHTRRAVMTVEEHHSPPIVGGHPRTPWGEPQRAVAYAGRIGYS